MTKSNLYKRPDFKIETSFDDGSIHDLRIADLLCKYHLSATFYIVVDWVGREGMLNWDQIKELEKKGFKIGSHTMTHPQDLKMLFDEELHVEIQTSKDMIETALGHNIESFCYPRGRMDDRIKNKVIEAGYTEARITGKPGILVVEDKYRIPGTLHIFQREEYGSKSIVEYATDIFEKLKKDGGYCNIWGHSEEINRNNNWEQLEEVLSLASKV